MWIPKKHLYFSGLHFKEIKFNAKELIAANRIRDLRIEQTTNIYSL